MRRKRTFAAVMSSALLALALSACGPDNTSSNDDSAGETASPTHSAPHQPGKATPSASASAKTSDDTASVNEPDPDSMSYVCDVIGDLSALVGKPLVSDDVDAGLSMAHPPRVGNCAYTSEAYDYYAFSVMYAGKELMTGYELQLGRNAAGYSHANNYGSGTIVDTSNGSPTYVVPNGDRAISIDTGNFTEYLAKYGNGVTMDDVVRHIIKQFRAVKH
jgi:hypothetical protein